MALRPLEDIVGPLVLPIRGKEYTMPRVSLADGVKIHAARTKGEELSGQELYRIILGDAHIQMLADLVPGDIIDRAFYTAYTDFTAGRESAEEVWENGIPKELREAAKEVLQLLAASRKAQAQTPAKTPQAAATTTRSRASGSTTNAKKPRAARAKAGS